MPLALGLVLARPGWGAESGWKPAPVPLSTRWAVDVTPEHARPDYPRPQMVRRAWLNLNGLWQFAFDDHDQGRRDGWPAGKELPLRILVPFTFEAALSGIGRGSEVHERVWYRRAFTLPASWERNDRVLLHFGAVDWEATVWVNGREVGSHRGGYAPFTLDITDAFRATGPQEMVVAVHDPADPRQGAFQPMGKQLGSHGIFYTRTTGIWQTVWLEPVPRTHLSGLAIETEPETGLLTVTARVAEPPAHARVRLSLRTAAGGAAAPPAGRAGTGWVTATREVGANGTAAVAVQLSRPRLWTPETPNLYDLTVELLDGEQVVDRVGSYAGFRGVGTRAGRLVLNGRPYFYRGVLDQGYWPAGILTPPTDAAIRAEVQMTRSLGFNTARKHVKVEDPRWYYWCDRLGLAVWQDMPSSHNLQSEEAKANFRHELSEMVENLRSHPSVVQWIAFNENWGNPGPFQDEMVRLVRSLDPSRPITDASGWTQRELTDVIDTHDYSSSLRRQGVEHPTKPKVVGEFGGIALPVPGHTWTQGWGYQTVRAPDDLLRRLRDLVSQLYAAPNLSGFIYTQLTDVEQEQNGLLTYDRLPKAPPERVAAIMTGRDRISPGELRKTGYVTDWWVLGPVPIEGRITSAQPNAENERLMGAALARPWLPDEAAAEPRENVSVHAGGRELRWKHVKAPLDTLDLNQALGQTDNAVAYAVAVFEVTHFMSGLTLRFASDDAARVWLNGQRIWTVNTTRGVNLDEDEVPGVSLREGRNVLVVKVVQGVGGWGLAARFVRPDGKPIEVEPAKGSGSAGVPPACHAGGTPVLPAYQAS